MIALWTTPSMVTDCLEDRLGINDSVCARGWDGDELRLYPCSSPNAFDLVPESKKPFGGY